MTESHDILTGSLMDDTWLTLDQLAAACQVETTWLVHYVDEGLFPSAQSIGGSWRFPSEALLRAKRMRQLERTFESGPELAALVADMLEEMDLLRTRLRRAGLV